MDLMKGGSAIPRESEQNINLSAYNRVERDMSGNIIGLSGRVQVNPITGVTEGKIAQDYTATQQSPSNLEAFKARQNPYDSEIQKSVSMASKKYKAKKSAMNGVEYGFDESLTRNPYR
jgi:ABC-type lipoprotein release transport system permease subunit